MLNALTVDVEDYYQVSAFEDRISRKEWEQYPSRVVEYTYRLLDLFDSYSVKATFFVLGWTAWKFPRLVEEIQKRNHELGSHSFWHRLVYQQTPDEFRTDLRDSLQAIEDASGIRPKCYRAPSFSVTRKSQWALDILREEEVYIDSSIYPIYHDRYGMPGSDARIHLRHTESGNILEFPPAVFQTKLGNFPFSGGGYFRLYPYWITAGLIRRLHRQGRPLMFYIHPWEIDPEQPQLPSPSRTKTARHRVNLKKTYSKLESLLNDFTFGTLTETIRRSDGAALLDQVLPHSQILSETAS